MVLLHSCGTLPSGAEQPSFLMLTSSHRWRILIVLFGALARLTLAQTTATAAAPELGTPEHRPQHSGSDRIPNSDNPFRRFIGEWTLKEDNWTQNWGQGTEHIKIPQHHTVCKPLNTGNSLLWIVDGPPPHGHILWIYNRARKEVEHLSSFAPARSGVGKGTVGENGDVTSKVSFEGEPEGTYRIYTYKWISDDEYELRSVQYDRDDKPTGGFYGGTFVRIKR